MPTDPQTPPTLAAQTFETALQLTPAVCDAAFVAYKRVLHFDAEKYPDWTALRAAASAAMRAVLVAALTPEPVTPPVAVPAGSFVDVAARVRQQLENEPDDDGRGLAVDMLDVDRLRDLAAHLAPHRRTWLRAFCDRLATQITETLSLRADDKAHRKEIRLLKAEQERDALQRTYDALVARCMELPGR